VCVYCNSANDVWCSVVLGPTTTSSVLISDKERAEESVDWPAAKILARVISVVYTSMLSHFTTSGDVGSSRHCMTSYYGTEIGASPSVEQVLTPTCGRR
jgi:hypothetical protein